MEKQKRKLKLENPWKLAFFILVAILVGAMCFILIRITQVREPSKQVATTIESGSSAFHIQLTKSQANELINFYLNEFLENSSVKYDLILENQALLSGTFGFFGYGLKFYLYFEPYVLENGDVQLKAKSLSIGTLSLPISELMNYVANSFMLPSWVAVNAADETITLHLNQYKLKNGMYLEAEQIDLVGDVIQFNAYLPKKNTNE